MRPDGSTCSLNLPILDPFARAPLACAPLARAAAIVGALAVVLAAAVPFASAADPATGPAGGGFFAGVDALSLRPAGASTDYAVVDVDADLDLEGAVRSVEPSSDVVPRVTLGWRWIGPWSSPAEITVSGWRYDADETDRCTSGAGGSSTLWDVLSPPNIALGAFDGSARARAGLDSRVIDLSYAQTVLALDDAKDGRAGVRVRAGLRQLRHDAALDVAYTGTSRDVAVSTRSEARGLGVRAGVEGTLPVAPRVRLEGEMSYGLLRGTVKTHYTAASLAAFPAIDLALDRDRNISTLDGALRVSIAAWRDLTIRASVEWSRWSDVVDTLTFLDDVQQASFVVGTGDATWQAASVGVGWRW